MNLHASASEEVFFRDRADSLAAGEEELRRSIEMAGFVPLAQESIYLFLSCPLTARECDFCFEVNNHKISEEHLVA